MDVQLRRGILEVCVLKALQERDSYGYQIIKDISPYVSITESTLYPILRRMEAAGYVTERSVEHSGRLRKYYHLTASGNGRIAEFLTEWEELLRAYSYIRGNEDG